MNNYAIADQLSLLAKLMDIHGENAFKAKSYAAAAFSIEKLPKEIADLPEEKIFAIKGIGESVGRKILELIQTGELAVLKVLLSQTPEGVLEMMNIKGLGPKKINTIWKELRISTLDELKEACRNNRIAEKKGFGEKTQQKILEAIHFQEQNSGKYLYAQLEHFTEAFTAKLRAAFPEAKIEPVGAYRRQLEIIDLLEWVTTIPKSDLLKFITRHQLTVVTEAEDTLIAVTEAGFQLQFYLTDGASYAGKLFQHSCSNEFFTAWQRMEKNGQLAPQSEEELFAAAGLPFIPPFLRETENVLSNASRIDTDQLIQTHHIKGLIHAHSNWSDGAYTIEDMAKELIRLGFDYLVLSDHSKAAYYANGLSEDRIRQQHRHIDELNEQLAPFKIYKSIECDILSDGSLDYSNKVLATFDLVIASVHSNLDMEEEKAMQRLMGAIENPYVTMMGHLTGRRLLRRKGYPVDHKAVIDACARNGVAIEINASPERLDMDWRWIEYALEKGVLLSINPDAHSVDDFQNLRYGVLVAQKGALTPAQNISSFGRDAFEAFLAERRHLKGV